MSASITPLTTCPTRPMSDDRDALHVRLDGLERLTSQTQAAIERISQSLAVLTRLEVEHGHTREALSRAFKEMAADRARLGIMERQLPERLVKRLGELEREVPGDLRHRLGDIENRLPKIELAARWVFAGIVTLATLVAYALVSTVLSKG